MSIVNFFDCINKVWFAYRQIPTTLTVIKELVKMFIYRISFPKKLSKKVYIGQTSDPDTRFARHKRTAELGSILKDGSKNIRFVLKMVA